MSAISSLTVERVKHPILLEEFYHDYYLPRIPVIITTDALSQLGWQTHKWTNDYLLYKAGTQIVLVLHGDDNSNFAPDRARYSPMPFHEFMAKVMLQPIGDNNLYLNLQNDRAIDPPLMQLMGDFNIPVYFKDLVLRCVNLWMGNSQSSITTPLHHDFNDNLYVVVEGRKNFTLFPPDQAVNLYPQGELIEIEGNGHIRYASLDNKPHMSRLNFPTPDLDRFPKYAEALKTRHDCQIEKNDMLFLPTGWFHQVTSIGRHIAVSFFSVPPSLEQMRWLKQAIEKRRSTARLG
jgi:mannose-6-phosphate isomerase-like protein (cupin superfamily)